jgi:hypothetical protein
MIAKFNYVRSKRLMNAYRTIPCQHCGKSNGTVVGAHSNQYIHGHARGIKSSDIFCASLCADCHFELDNGKLLTRDARISMWNRAHIKTKELLTQLGVYQW